MSKKRFLLPVAAIAAAALLAGCASDGNNNGSGEEELTPLTLQFVPTRTEQDMEAAAQPLAKLLSEQLGREVKVTIATDYTTIIEAMASNKIDIGIMPPATYAIAHDQGAADAILSAQIQATDEKTASKIPGELVDGFRGEILVRADSGLNSLQDLKGKSLAVQGPASASGYIFPIVEISEAGMDIHKDISLINIAGIDSAILAVINGEVDAALSFEGGRSIMKGDFPNITDEVKVLYLTKAKIPNDAIAVNTKMDAALREQVRAAFLAIAADPAGLEIVSKLYSHMGYVESNDSDFNIVREYTKKAAEL
ncbi:MAG: phosphate/phosphite/phosphonate ABC transporter substrate-binding protein [Microbacteriaceae bacterium]